jgi:hypothetical protein
MRPLGIAAIAAAFAGLLAVAATWPQALEMGTAISSHQDPYFSVWRVMWIAHALVTSPFHLFDANIFYPTTGTLAFSDATMLQGIVAAPLVWSRVPPVLVYNLLLLAGYAGSALAMFVLVRRLTGAIGPALVAAAVFTLVPYRTEHVMHLELQWAMWIPLAFWALHRSVDEPSSRFGILAGIFVWLQVLSCVYYGVFLALVLVPVAPVILVLSGRQGLRALPRLALGALVACLLTAPYAWPYLKAAQVVGARDATEIARYSARAVNFLAAAPSSWLWGWTADRWGGPELRLYPGIVALLLAVAGLAHRQWRHTLVHLLVLVVAVDLSFGVNGFLFPRLAAHVDALSGLRAVARTTMVATAALAVLAGLGAQVVVQRGGASSSGTALRIAAMLVLMAADYAHRPLAVTHETLGTLAPVYRIIQSAGPGVVAELPMPSASRLPGNDPYYSAWSITHWHKLVNGYSGYHPRDYLETLARMETFPDNASIERLKARDVRYIVVHQAFYDPATYTALMLKMAVHPKLRPYGSYRDPVGNADVFLLEP